MCATTVRFYLRHILHVVRFETCQRHLLQVLLYAVGGGMLAVCFLFHILIREQRVQCVSVHIFHVLTRTSSVGKWCLKTGCLIGISNTRNKISKIENIFLYL